MTAIFKAIRPINLLLIALLYHAFLFLEVSYGNFHISDTLAFNQFEIYTLSILLITAAGYLINDFYDIETDALNKSNKTKLSQPLNLIFYFIFNTCAIALLFFGNIDETLIWVSIGSIGLLWFYSFLGQKLPLIGNIIVAFLTALLPFLYLFLQGYTHLGCDETFAQSDFQVILIYYGLSAFSITLFREIIKDIEDIEGDRTAHYKTLPIITTVKTAKSVAIFFLLITISLLTLFLAYFESFTTVSFMVLALTSGFTIIKTGNLAIKAKSKSDFSKTSNWSKLTMFSALVFIIVHALTL